MKFGQPLLTTELSGSMGGATASKSRGAVNYFRVRRRPSNPRTFNQLVVRAAMTTLSAAWTGSLTDAQRASWTAIAGETQSGIDAYMAANSLRLQAGLARVDTAPASLNLAFVAVPDFATFNVEDDAGTQTIISALNGTAVTQAGNILMGYLATRKQPAGALAQVAPFQFAGQLVSAAAPIVIPVTTRLETLLANITANDKVYAKLRCIHATNGQFTEELTAPLVVTEA